MRDFACQKNHQQINSGAKLKQKEVKKAKAKQIPLLQGFSRLFKIISKILKSLFSLVVLLVVLIIGSYLFFDSLIEHFFPLSKTVNFLLVLDQPGATQRQSCYFLSIKPSLQKYFLATLPDGDCSWLSEKQLNLDAMKRSEQLGVIIDQVLYYQVESEIALKTLSTKQLSQILTKLAKQKFVQTKKWQETKQLLQLRQVLTHYQFQGKNFLQQAVSLDKLASFVLTDESVCTLGVLNTTTTAGLASQIATILEQSGISVLRITNADQENYQHLINSVLITQQDVKICEAEIERLINWFGQRPLTIKQDQQLTDRYRSNLILLIGQDFN